MDEAYRVIGANIKRLRQARGLSAYRLAFEVGTEPPHLWRWETGRRLPSAFYLLRLSYCLGCGVDHIFAGVVAGPDGWLVEGQPQGAA